MVGHGAGWLGREWREVAGNASTSRTTPQAGMAEEGAPRHAAALQTSASRRRRAPSKTLKTLPPCKNSRTPREDVGGGGGVLAVEDLGRQPAAALGARDGWGGVGGVARDTAVRAPGTGVRAPARRLCRGGVAAAGPRAHPPRVHVGDGAAPRACVLNNLGEVEVADCGGWEARSERRARGGRMHAAACRALRRAADTAPHARSRGRGQGQARSPLTRHDASTSRFGDLRSLHGQGARHAGQRERGPRRLAPLQAGTPGKHLQACPVQPAPCIAVPAPTVTLAGCKPHRWMIPFLCRCSMPLHASSACR